MKRSNLIFLNILAVLILAAIFSYLDPPGHAMQGWFAYLIAFAFGTLILHICRRVLPAGQHAKKVFGIVLIGLALRLAVSVGISYALPQFGYDEEVQQAGYVFSDAYYRDSAAWRMAESEVSLLSAFTGGDRSDQYGGLLFISSAAYRYLSPDLHRALLVSVFASFAGALAIFFGWGFTEKFFGVRPAFMAAWIIALFPDAILVSASQMREPFLIFGLSIVLYALSIVRKESSTTGWVFAACGLVLLVLVSPPYAAIATLLFGLGWIWGDIRKHVSLRSVLILLAILLVIAIALILTLRAWSVIAESSGIEGLAVFEYWLLTGSDYQRFLLERGSGTVQKMFALAPEWMQVPMTLLYGLVQPFLPASAFSEGAVVWTAIGIWRGIGWMVMLMLLVYSFLAVLGSGKLLALPGFLALTSWGWALVTSYRAAGDLWDNPRYRVVLIVVQAALAGWAWDYSRRQHSPWWKRIAAAIGYVYLIFMIWYAGRYQLIPRIYIRQTLTLSVVGFVIIIAAGICWDRMQRSKGSLTE